MSDYLTNRIVGIAVLLVIVGYIAWKLFWFIAESRQEEGKAYTEKTRKGFLWKEFFACIWKTVLVLLIISVILFTFDLFENDTEDVQEEETVIEDDVDEEGNRVFSWEVDYKIADDIMEATPKSSYFSNIGYDSKKEVLILQFKKSGYTYVYLDFSNQEWLAFRKAKSLDSYFNKNIKGQYTRYKLVRGLENK